MFILVIGPNDSGKSKYAEGIIGELEGNSRYYIATMIPYGEEGKARVKKHLCMRKDLNFETIEDPYLEKTNKVLENSDVLLEDLSNLIANRMFEKGHGSSDTIVEELVLLNKKVRNLVVVSIGGIVAEGYDADTIKYINTLNDINEKLELIVDKSVKM